MVICSLHLLRYKFSFYLPITVIPVYNYHSHLFWFTTIHLLMLIRPWFYIRTTFILTLPFLRCSHCSFHCCCCDTLFSDTDAYTFCHSTCYIVDIRCIWFPTCILIHVDHFWVGVLPVVLLHSVMFDTTGIPGSSLPTDDHLLTTPLSIPHSTMMLTGILSLLFPIPLFRPIPICCSIRLFILMTFLLFCPFTIHVGEADDRLHLIIRYDRYHSLLIGIRYSICPVLITFLLTFYGTDIPFPIDILGNFDTFVQYSYDTIPILDVDIHSVIHSFPLIIRCYILYLLFSDTIRATTMVFDICWLFPFWWYSIVDRLHSTIPRISFHSVVDDYDSTTMLTFCSIPIHSVHSLHSFVDIRLRYYLIHIRSIPIHCCCSYCSFCSCYLDYQYSFPTIHSDHSLFDLFPVEATFDAYVTTQYVPIVFDTFTNYTFPCILTFILRWNLLTLVCLCSTIR